jgi:hypothetical protein
LCPKRVNHLGQLCDLSPLSNIPEFLYILTALLLPDLPATTVAETSNSFDFNQTPFAPPGTKVIVLLKANNRASSEYHGEEGWCIGPSMEHYHCVKCFLPTTNRVRDADTVKFFPHQIPFPSTTTTDNLCQQATNNVLSILKDLPKSSLHSNEVVQPIMH